MLRILTILFLILLSTAVFAGDFDTIIIPPSEPVAAGDAITVEIYFMNSSNNIGTIKTQEPIKCRLVSGDTISEIQLTPTPSGPSHEITVPANGFIKKLYTFEVPTSSEGIVGIELARFNSKKALFTVLKTDDLNTKYTAEKSKNNETFEDIQNLFQSEFPYFSAYEPTYFGVGKDPEKSKFQFSFKYKLVDITEHEWAKNNPWLSGFYFAYTQTSLWDLKSESKPFDDTSYKPELFYLTKNINPHYLKMSHLYFRTGFQHESNGKGGEASRSTNYFYFIPISAFNIGNDYYLKIAPKVWAYTGNDDETNRDIEDYRGYFDLELKFGKRNSLVVGSNLRHGSKGSSIQMDATYPLYKILFLDEKQDWLNPNLYFHVQYFNGYSESLIRYNEKSHAIRLGIALVR